jgi:hypothetical protein
MGVIGSGSSRSSADCDGDNSKLPKTNAQAAAARRQPKALRANPVSFDLGNCGKVLRAAYSGMWSQKRNIWPASRIPDQYGDLPVPKSGPTSKPTSRHTSSESLHDDRTSSRVTEADSGDCKVDHIRNHGRTSWLSRSGIDAEFQCHAMSDYRVPTRHRWPV